MTITHPIKKILLSALLAGAVATPALAQISINISIAPPQQQYEVVPVLAPDRVWAPGYWAWTGDRYVWVRGQAIMKRDGYRWEPDRWEQKGNGYQRHPGNWVREIQYVPVKDKKAKKTKKLKKLKNDQGKRHGEKNGKGPGPKH